MAKNIAVLGLGNPLMADEGVGIEVVSRLLSRSSEFPDVDFIDAGTAGFGLLHKLSGRRRVIIIDCCRMASPPGTIATFTPDDVNSVKKLSHFSVHEADILQVIDLARRVGDCPENIVIFGIEPVTVEMRTSLSTLLAERLDDYLEQVVAQLVKWH
jgi:hydrogenase maturation protease